MTATKTAQRPLLELAREAMPALTATQTALDTVRAAQTTARQQARSADDLPAQVLDAVLAGKPVPDDIGQRVVDLRRDNESVIAALEVLRQVEDGLYEHRRSSIAQQVDLGLAVLADHLADLLAQARPAVEALVGITEAEDAITAGRVEQWTTLRRLSSRYAELRTAQAVLVSEGLFPPDDARRQRFGVVSSDARRLVDSFGTVRNFAAIFPEGLPQSTRSAGGSEPAIRNGRIVTSRVEDTRAAPPPWLTGDPAAALRYLTGPDAQPWCPTIAESTAARDDAARAAQDKPRSLGISEARARALTRKLRRSPSRSA